MKCPKCGSEQNGAFCTECGTPLQEQVKVQEESTTKNNTETIPDTSYFNIPNPEEIKPPKKEKKKLSKRTVFEIVGGVLLVVFMIAAIGGGNDGVPQEKYDQLNAENESLQSQLDEATASLEEVTAEYDAYKSEMSRFDGMSDEEIDAIIAEIDAREAEEQAAAEAEAAEEQARQDAIASATTEQLNALASAESYIDLMGFSYSGLIDQLEFEGYSTEAATYAADNCGADWNEEAAESAQSYMDVMSFSRQGLIDQLIFEGFTQEQAEYGASAVGY